MLDIGWIFKDGHGIRELIVALMQSPYESIFDTELVITLVELFIQKSKKALITKCFIPYVTYFIFTISFLTFFTSPGINQSRFISTSSLNDNIEAKLLAYFMGSVIIILDFYFLFYELVVIKRDGFKAWLFSDFFNWIDMINSVQNAVLVFATFAETETTYDDRV